MDKRKYYRSICSGHLGASKRKLLSGYNVLSQLGHTTNISDFVIVFFWSGHVSSSLWSNVSNVTSLKDCFLRVFSTWICHCHCLCICICHCLSLGQFISPHQSDQISQKSQVSKDAPWRCSLNVYVFFIVVVFFFVFVFVIAFFWARSSLFITLIKWLKGHKSLGSLFEGVF